MTKQSNLRCFNDLHSYAELKQHFQCCQKLHMRRLFSIDSNRHKRMSLEFDWILLDYSKNRITDKTLTLLFELAREANLEQSISDLFDSSKRRALPSSTFGTSTKDRSVTDRLVQRMFALTNKLHSGQCLGFTQKPITDVVNIGITSSGLGAQSVCQALRPYHQPKNIETHFVTGVDGFHLEDVLTALNPETTLIIVSSRTFGQSNPETLIHAETAKRWLFDSGQPEQLLNDHLLAVTANQQGAIEFGISEENVFQLESLIDQRQTSWLSMGLPILLSIGERHFQDFMEGVDAMDEHYRNEPLEQNMPVILALIGIWYTNFFASESHAILPYDHNLRHLPRYIEQIDMQSNGKSLDRFGNVINYATAPIVWSGNGLNTQHAFYQMLHRGQKMVPADFIVSMRTHSVYQKQHNLMFANAVAQTEALMRGRTLNETMSNLDRNGSRSGRQDETLIPHRIYDGNNPSNMLLLQRLTPKSLGILLTLYEYKTVTQGAIWNLSSHDQAGSIELGKTLSSNVLRDIFMPAHTQRHDASTNALINHYRNMVYPRKGSKAPN